jgi:hypothetical protein
MLSKKILCWVKKLKYEKATLMEGDLKEVNTKDKSNSVNG